jgi:hypothetical protein
MEAPTALLAHIRARANPPGRQVNDGGKPQVLEGRRNGRAISELIERASMIAGWIITIARLAWLALWMSMERRVKSAAESESAFSRLTHVVPLVPGE